MDFYLDVEVTRDDERCFGGIGEEGRGEGWGEMWVLNLAQENGGGGQQRQASTWDNLMMCAASMLVASSAWFFLFVLWKRDSGLERERRTPLHLQAPRYAPRGR